MELINKYFPDLSQVQLHQFSKLHDLYLEWNEKINVISRQDTAHIVERHILHSLAIAKVLKFTPGTQIMDVGTGGGLPGLPLAIFFPEAKFTLVDSIGKKIKVVNEIIDALELDNVRAYQKRAEEVPHKFDFITGRGVTNMIDFTGYIRKKIRQENQNGLPNGVLYLKGGDLSTEKEYFGDIYDVMPISDYYQEAFFESKVVVYLDLSY